MHAEIRKILVVDDEDSIVNLLVSILSLQEFEVIAAYDGRQGLELYEKEKPDLVITDIIMPDMEGIEFVRRLRKIDRELPIIAMSGNPTGTQFLKTASLLGANSTLQKPFSSEELLNRISEIEIR